MIASSSDNYLESLYFSAKKPQNALICSEEFFFTKISMWWLVGRLHTPLSIPLPEQKPVNTVFEEDPSLFSVTEVYLLRLDRIHLWVRVN